MTKEQKYNRRKAVILMDTIMRNINDESYWLEWATIGVADGDISEDTDVKDVDDYYISAENFEELVRNFCELVRHAQKHNNF